MRLGFLVLSSLQDCRCYLRGGAYEGVFGKERRGAEVDGESEGGGNGGIKRSRGSRYRRIGIDHVFSRLSRFLSILLAPQESRSIY